MYSWFTLLRKSIHDIFSSLFFLELTFQNDILIQKCFSFVLSIKFQYQNTHSTSLFIKNESYFCISAPAKIQFYYSFQQYCSPIVTHIRPQAISLSLRDFPVNSFNEILLRYPGMNFDNSISIIHDIRNFIAMIY